MAAATKPRKAASKVKAAPKPAMLVLKYYQAGSLQYSYFTVNEQQTAIDVAAVYDSKGFKPRLYFSPYDGEGFRTLYDWESRARKAKKAA